MPFETAETRLLPQGALPIGLGCSRLGSVNGASGPEAAAVIQTALDEGIRFFDTSSIYGQGDSERLIGQVLGNRNDCIVCSKAGKYLTWKRRLLLPVKGLLRGVARRSVRTRSGVATARSKPMPVRWDKRFLQQSIDSSLRRLRRERIEMFMLHSPAAEVLLDGGAMDALAEAQKAGKLGLIGVSPDDASSATAALKDPRVQALQIPMRPGDNTFGGVAAAAAAAGVYVIAREILGGAQAVSGAADPSAHVRERIAGLIRQPQVTLPLVGTTKVQNLAACAAAARNVV